MADPDQTDDRSEPDRAGPKIAAGLVAATAGIRLGPEVALGLGAAGPLFESLAERAWEELRPDARRRTAQVLSTAGETAGCDAEQLGERISASETSRLQAGLAMDAAARTAWPPQVKALGRVLAAGLLASDEAEVNLQQQALAAMTDLDRLHLILLELLVRFEPDARPGTGIEAVPHTVPSYQPLYLGGEGPGNPLEWTVGRRKWTARDICAVRPQLQPVLAGVAGTLVRHGLAEQIDRRIERMEQIARDLQQRAETGHGSPIRPPSAAQGIAHDMERSCSPTELGEQVLGFYLEAGDESVEDN